MNKDFLRIHNTIISVADISCLYLEGSVIKVPLKSGCTSKFTFTTEEEALAYFNELEVRLLQELNIE